jgi:hypothetical protein
VRHHHHQRRRIGDYSSPSIFLLPCGKGEIVVLQGQGSCWHVGKVLHGVPREVLSFAQNHYPKGKNHQFLARIHRNHTRGVGEAPRIHPCMPTPRYGKLAGAL